MEKGEPTKEVWYCEHPYPPGYKSYSKTKPLRVEEFAPEKKWWPKRKESDYAWKVSLGDIKARGYNLDTKNPSAVDDGPGDPDALLAEYKQVAAEVARIRDSLRDELRRASDSAQAAYPVAFSGTVATRSTGCLMFEAMVSQDRAQHVLGTIGAYRRR